MKYWEIIADNLKKAGWGLGWLSAIDSQGEQSESLTRIAATEGTLLCMRTNCSLRLWNLNVRC